MTVQLRTYIYDVLIDRGTPPTIAEIAERFRVAPALVREKIANLKIGKTLIPHPVTGEVWMAGPFAASPTAYRVVGARTSWFANCAWDMLGIPILLGETMRVLTRCAHCDVKVEFDVAPDQPPQRDEIVHFLVPAARWYEDIGFT
jgi:hypothetical protein